MLPKLDFEELIKRIPSPLEKQLSRDLAWRKELAGKGWKSLAASPNHAITAGLFGMDSALELPPFLRIGRLSLEESRAVESPVEAYLREQDYPAFVSLRDVPGVTFGAPSQNTEVARMAQVSLVHLMGMMNPTVIKITALDVTHWGSACNILAAANPALKTITNRQQKFDFFGGLNEEAKKNIKLMGIKHSSLASHNRANPEAPEPYQLIYISSFEKDLDDEERDFVRSLARSGTGYRAGIYLFILFEENSNHVEFTKSVPNMPSVVVEMGVSGFAKIEIHDPTLISTVENGKDQMFEIIPDQNGSNTIESLVERCHAHFSARRVIKVMLPLDGDDFWKSSTSDGINVPIGKSGSSLVNFILGKPEIVYNALVGGAVGTGKTILLHSIICQALQKYSPQELSLSLLDYKEGTEFSVYSEAPHIFALSLGPNTKFGIDVLKGLVAERSRRATLFKEQGVSDLASYRSATGKVLCRHLVVIDEFQVLLNHPRNGDIAQQLLEDLIRLGRSFGFNVILSSQSLSDGALPPAIRSNLGCRICLRLSERECMDFLGPDNMLPTKFEQPGQAVYNTREGLKEGNLEFRVAFYEQAQIASFLRRMNAAAVERNFSKSNPSIYNGEVPLEISFSSLNNSDQSIIVAVEEGVPAKNYKIFLGENRFNRTLFVVGTGNTRKSLNDLIVYQLDRLNVSYQQIAHGAEMGSFCERLLSGELILEDNTTIVFDVTRVDCENCDIKRSWDLLSESEERLLVVFFDNTDTMSDVNFDRNDVGIVICVDRKAADRLSYGTASDVSDSTQTAILLIPYEEPVLVRIPTITNTK